MVRNRTRVTVHGEGTPMLRLRLNLNPQRFCSVRELREVLAVELQAALGRRIIIPPGTQLFYRSSKNADGALGGLGIGGGLSPNNDEASTTGLILGAGGGSNGPPRNTGLGVRLAPTGINDASRTRRANEAFASANGMMSLGGGATSSGSPTRRSLLGDENSNTNNAPYSGYRSSSSRIINSTMGNGPEKSHQGPPTAASPLLYSSQQSPATHAQPPSDRRSADYFADFILLKDTGLINDGDEILIDEWPAIVEQAAEKEREEGRMRSLVQNNNTNSNNNAINSGSAYFNEVTGRTGGGGGTAGATTTANVSGASAALAKAQQQLLEAKAGDLGGGANAAGGQGGSSIMNGRTRDLQRSRMGGNGTATATTANYWSHVNTTGSAGGPFASPEEVLVFDIFSAGGSSSATTEISAPSADQHHTVSHFSTKRMSHQHLLMVQKLIRELMTYHVKIVTFLSSQCSKEAEIAAHDILQSQAQNNEVADTLIDEVTLGAKISDPLAAIRAVTQLAVQRGKEEREFSDGVEAEKVRQLASVYRARISRLEEELKAAEAATEALQQQIVERELDSQQTIQQLRAEVKRLEKSSADAMERVWALERANGQLQRQHREVATLNERLFQEANASIAAAAAMASGGGGEEGTDPSNANQVLFLEEGPGGAGSSGQRSRLVSISAPEILLSSFGIGKDEKKENANTGKSTRAGGLGGSRGGLTSADLSRSSGAATQVARRAEEERFFATLAQSNKHDGRSLLTASLQGLHPHVQSCTSPRLKAIGSSSATGGDVSTGYGLLSPSSLSLSSGAALTAASASANGGKLLPPIGISNANGPTANANNSLTNPNNKDSTTATVSNRSHWPTKDAVHVDSQNAANTDRSRLLNPKSLVPTIAPSAVQDSRKGAKREAAEEEAAGSLATFVGANNDERLLLSAGSLFPETTRSVSLLKSGNVPSSSANAILQINIATAAGASHVVRFELPRAQLMVLVGSGGVEEEVLSTPLMSLLLAAMPKLNDTDAKGRRGGGSAKGNAWSPFFVTNGDGVGGGIVLSSPLISHGTPSAASPLYSISSPLQQQSQQQQQQQNAMQAFYAQDLSNLILQGSRNALRGRLDPSRSFIAFYSLVMLHIRLWQSSSGRSVAGKLGGDQNGGVGGGGSGVSGASIAAALARHDGTTTAVEALWKRAVAAQNNANDGPSSSSVGGRSRVGDVSSSSALDPVNDKGHVAKDKNPSITVVLPALPQSAEEEEVAVRPNPSEDPSSSFLVFFRMYYVRNGQRFPIATDADIRTFLAPARGPVYTCNCVEIEEAPSEFVSALIRRGALALSEGRALLGGGGVAGGLPLKSSASSHGNFTSTLENKNVSFLPSVGWSTPLTTTNGGLVEATDGGAGDVVGGGDGTSRRGDLLIDEFGIPLGRVSTSNKKQADHTMVATTTSAVDKDGTTTIGGGGDNSPIISHGKKKPFFGPRRNFWGNPRGLAGVSQGGLGGAKDHAGNDAIASPSSPAGGEGTKQHGGDGAASGLDGADGGVDPTSPSQGLGDTEGHDKKAENGMSDIKAPLFSPAVTNNVFLNSAVVDVPSETRLRRIYQQLWTMKGPLPIELLDALAHERAAERHRHHLPFGSKNSNSYGLSSLNSPSQSVGHSKHGIYSPETDEFFAESSDTDDVTSAVNLYTAGANAFVAIGEQKRKGGRALLALQASGTAQGASNNNNNINTSSSAGGGGALDQNSSNKQKDLNGVAVVTGGKGQTGANPMSLAVSACGSNEDNAFLVAEGGALAQTRRSKKVTATHVLRYLCAQHDAMGDPARFWRLLVSVLDSHGIANGAAATAALLEEMEAAGDGADGGVASATAGGGEGGAKGGDGPDSGGKANNTNTITTSAGSTHSSKKGGVQHSATGGGSSAGGKGSHGALGNENALMLLSTTGVGLLSKGGGRGLTGDGYGGRKRGGTDGANRIAPINLRTQITFANFVLIVLKLLKE